MADPAVISQLRETLRAIEGSGFRRRPVLPFGLGRVDARLADGGLRLDALHEVGGGRADLGGGAAAPTTYRHALAQAMTLFMAPFFRAPRDGAPTTSCWPWS